MQYVYILKTKDSSTYKGCTNNLKNRLEKHQMGYIEATKHKLPVTLIFYCAFTDKHKAFEFEQYLKSGSGIAFKNKRLI